MQIACELETQILQQAQKKKFPQSKKKGKNF